MATIMMGMRIILFAAVVISVTGIKVPVEKTDERSTQTKEVDSEGLPEDDSYFVPSEDGDQPAEDISDEIATLATYLLPPSEEKQSEYYGPTEAGQQTDWYPIAPAIAPLPRALLPPRQTEINPFVNVDNLSDPIYYGTFRTGKMLDRERIASTPSRDLQPPLENAPNEYATFMNDETAVLPFENLRAPRPAGYPLRVWHGPAISVPNNIRINPKPQVTPKKYKNPTKLYPKKYLGAFKPVPIPLAQLNDEAIEVPVAKQQKRNKLKQNIENEYEIPYEDKKTFKYEEAQKKNTLKGEPEHDRIEESEASETHEDDSPPEQDTSASNYRVPIRNLYAAPIKRAPPTSPKRAPPAQSHSPPPDGERTEFRMHGMKGPHSYQFGFDTGKGKNRQFRYEERDNEGRVKGHYGYMDKHGKLRVVNYDADPEHGFRADAPVESE